jgi:PAS domain S-box-containing protein
MQAFHSPQAAMTADPVASETLREVLACTAEAVASISEGNIFETLVLGITRALGVDLAFVGVLIEGQQDVTRTIAFCDREQVVPNFEYELQGTPCQDVMGQEFRFHADGVQERFSDPRIKAIGGVGYAAIPLFDSLGRSIGLMAVVDRKPLRDRVLTEYVLKIFSVRAAIELERRTANEARRHSEESYRSIFEAAEDALFVKDADTGAILDVNPKACEVYGYSADEMRGLDIGMLSSWVPPYTLENAMRLIDRAKREGPVRVDWQGRGRDGSLHWDEVCVKLVKIGGVERILAVTRDISGRKRAEEERVRLEGQLRQAQKMEAIGQLTGTLGYVAMARERADGYGDAKLAKYLDRAERSGERAKA